MPPPLALVAKVVDQETVALLEVLLEQAKAGNVVGLAYVALHRGCAYSGDIVGTAKNNTLIARGLVSTLWANLPK